MKILLAGTGLALAILVSTIAHGQEIGKPPYLQALIPPDQIQPGDEARLKAICEADKDMVEDSSIIESPYGMLRLFGCMPKAMQTPQDDQVSKAPAKSRA